MSVAGAAAAPAGAAATPSTGVAAAPAADAAAAPAIRACGAWHERWRFRMTEEDVVASNGPRSRALAAIGSTQHDPCSIDLPTNDGLWM